MKIISFITETHIIYKIPDHLYLEPHEVFSTSVLGLPAGTYTFYFAVDTNMDGNITWDSLYADSVVVNVTE